MDALRSETMASNRKLKPIPLAALMLLNVPFCYPCHVLAADWSSCASDLDDVHSASDYASDAAREAHEAQEDVESKRSDLESCSSDCDIERSDYEDANSELADKVDALEGELSTLDSRIRDASASCEYELGASAAIEPHPKSKSSSPCAIYQRYKGRLPLETILKVCSRSMSESECRKCLGVGK